MTYIDNLGIVGLWLARRDHSSTSCSSPRSGAARRTATARSSSCASAAAGFFDYPEGTVYPALHRLERDGLVTSEWSTGAARRRRIYELTPGGRSLLVRERKEWALLARAIEAVVGT